MTVKRRYAAVGTGGRIPMFIDPIADTYRDVAELVGLCDTSAIRRTFHRDRLTRRYGTPEIPTYDAKDFDLMLHEQRPDIVIVCVPDYLHHEYIVRSLEGGADVISEKPLTIDAERYALIADAVRRTGRHVRTSFNYRWSPGVSKVREVIEQGTIGRVTHVDFEYQLNTSHGADYFRRWHSDKTCSEGLLVHKSTHHFDLVNWWIDAIPELVFALGDLNFYGKVNAIHRGCEEWTRYPRYSSENAAKDDPFMLSFDDHPTLDALYRKAEHENGYIRDRNVFRDGITIEDTMSVMIRYRTGVVANYSLVAYAPCEGYRVTITGDGGRLEYVERHASHIITGDTQLKTRAGEKHDMRLHVQKLFSESVEIPIVSSAGGHGGGDPLLQEQIFSPTPPPDVLKRNAGHEQGAASILIGAAANRSMVKGVPVKIIDLFRLAPDKIRLSDLG